MSKECMQRLGGGEIKGFTGIDDPYEPPLHAEMTIKTTSDRAEANARLILDYLVKVGFVRSDDSLVVNEYK